MEAKVSMDFEDIEKLEETPIETTDLHVREKPLHLIYVGPNVPGGILQRFQVFKGGFPPHCRDLFEKVPEIKEFFIPVEGLEIIRQKIEEAGTNEARLYDLLQKKLAKGVK
jgi:hypothetical protein